MRRHPRVFQERWQPCNAYRENGGEVPGIPKFSSRSSKEASFVWMLLFAGATAAALVAWLASPIHGMAQAIVAIESRAGLLRVIDTHVTDDSRRCASTSRDSRFLPLPFATKPLTHLLAAGYVTISITSGTYPQQQYVWPFWVC